MLKSIKNINAGKSLKFWLTKAKKEKFALPAFNAANIETINAIVAAAKNTLSPIIIEASHGEVSFLGAQNLISLVQNARKQTNLPLFTNLDHAPTPQDCLQAIKLGFDLVHYDGSKLPLSQNLKNTQLIVKHARKHNILVEAEIDHITGSSKFHPHQTARQAQKQGHYTDPQQAQNFVQKTQIDILASFIGNIHGIYKTHPRLDINRLNQISSQTDCFLSLHGGSGILSQEIKSAIKAGITKINVNSELRLAFKTTLQSNLEQSKELAIYKIMPPVVQAVQKIAKQKIKLFGSASKAK